MIIGMTTQIAIRVPEDLLASIDEVVAEGSATSRADAVRQAIGFWIRTLEQAKLDIQIAAGYDRIPSGTPDDWGDLEAALDWGTAAMLADLERQEREAGFEPW